MRAAIYLSAVGPQGLRETAELCLQKAHYAVEKIVADDRFELAFQQPVFKEFVIRDTKGNVADVLAECNESGILAGIPLATWYPELADCFLVAVTEKRTKHEIDQLADCLTRASVTDSVVSV